MVEVSDLENILQQDINNNPGDLVLQKDGKLELRPLRWGERFSKRLGFGPASAKKVMQYMETHKKDLSQIADKLKDNRKALAVAQERINILFQKINRSKDAPDLYLHINQDWMGELPDEVRQQPLNKLRIPGAHDSAAYQLKLDKTPSGMWKVAAFFVNITRFFGVKKLVEDFTMTQNYSIEKQLELGARYLDFRVMYNPSDKKYYLSHSFACLEVDEAFRQIRAFMDKHPKEVVFLQIEADERHRDNFKPAHTDDLLAKLNSKFGDIAARRDPNADSSINMVGTMSLQELIAKNKRVIIGLPGTNKIAAPATQSPQLTNIFWHSNLNNEGWLGENTVEKGQTAMSNKMQEKGKNTGSINCVAASVTPEGQEIATEAARRFMPITQLFDKFKRRVPTVRERGQKMNTHIKSSLENSTGYRGVVYCYAPDHSSAFHDIIRSNHPPEGI